MVPTPAAEVSVHNLFEHLPAQEAVAIALGRRRDFINRAA
jgi:hypothetical protein